MDARSVSSCLFLICIALSTGLETISFEETKILPPPVSTVPTYSTSPAFPTIEIAESKVSKNYATFSSETDNDYSREPDVEGAPPDHIVPYSEHENPEEPSTRTKYTNGNVNQGIRSPRVELDFVPTKLYAQVRKTHTVKRVPREDALRSATNEEEILAAPRLREVVTKSKTNTVYTEEGYEDAAYDHGGHIRDADFQEDYTKKIGDQEDTGELNDVEKETEIEESDKTEKSQDRDDATRNADKLDRLWQDPSINPKQITENEIERLEKDLESEYEESEKNAETGVPENLKNPDESDEEEESELLSRAATDHRDENKVEKQNDESEDASDEYFKRDASTESSKSEVLRNFFSKPNENQKALTSENPSVDYGKVFWDYFKSVGNNRKPDELTEPVEIEKTTRNYETFSPQGFSSVPSFPDVHTTLDSFNTDFDLAPGPKLSSFITSRMDHSPSAASLYESWKRQDQNEDFEESYERDAADSLDFYGTKSEEEIREAEDFERNASALNLQNIEGSTTLIGPKKLSYTVIIRPSEKPRTDIRPCDHEAHKRPGERTPVVKSLSSREPELSTDGINDFSNANDFTVIERPLPAAVPLRQLTYADFVPHSYASLARPSVTPEEIETRPKQINNFERDRYEFVKNPYVNHPQNLHPRYNRLRAHPKRPRHLYPITKLVPPSSIPRSKYTDFSNVQSVGRSIKKYDTISNFHPWPEIMRFYRSIERRIFPRRKRSLNNENTRKNSRASLSHANKIRDDIYDLSSVKQLRRKRNLFGESNRLVEADNEAASEKSIGRGNRLRRSGEKLLHDAPRIVDEVIDGEIESRFKDDDDRRDESSDEDDEEKPENRSIEVPDFNFSEVTENNEREKIVTKPAVRKAPLDVNKYPYYENSKIPRSSALKYVTNPRTVPRKTLGGTEFYDSRDRYRECDEVKPDLDGALPSEKNSEEEDEDEEDGDQQRGSRPRLHGLGDRLDCFRAKYFDDNPLDNPLFLEEKVGQPRLPEELDPKRLNLRIFDVPSIQEHQIVRRVSRRPELIAGEINRTRPRNNRVENRANRINAEKDAKAQQSRLTEGRRIPKSHRIRKHRLETTTKAPVILTTPYQHQVYEDVMGTIKNLAGLYETFGEPSISASSILPEESRALATPRDKKIDFQSIHITEKPRGFMVQGLLPPESTEPPKFQRYRIIPYRTNKVSYRTRLRMENTPGGGGPKLGYFRTVTVHKRSVEDPKKTLDLKQAASRRSIGVLPTYNLNDAKALNNENSGSKKLEVDVKPGASERIVYTVQDRIRHSKPRGNLKFGNLETSASENVRSQEARSNGVARSNQTPGERRYGTKPRRLGSEDATGELTTASTNSTSKNPASGGHDYLDEPNEMYKIQYSTTHGRQIEPNNLDRRNVEEASEDYDSDKNLEKDSAEKEDRREKYGIEEQSEDHDTNSNSNRSSSEVPGFYRLRKYLESEPPGYSEAFGKKSSSSESEEPEISYKSAETRKESQDAMEKEKNEENDDEEEHRVEKPSESLVDEDSSSGSVEENDESLGQLKSQKENEDDSDIEDTGEGQDEEDEEETHSPLTEEETASRVEDSEKEFERFASRPYSPFESFEDSKYMDLGPRLSKPYFYHPSFSTLNYRRQKYSKGRENEESRESDEKNSKYVFPWDADRSHDDDADGEKSSEESLKIEKYEYPWERRERLARERRRKAKEKREHERLYGFSEDEDDEEEDDESENPSGTELREKRVFPWKHYESPSKRSGRKKTNRTSRITDNEEMSSEHRPRFSSRYKNANSSSDNDNDPVATSIEAATNDEPTKLAELPDDSILRSNKTVETSVTSTRRPPIFTVPPKKATRRRIQTRTTSTTPSAKNSSETRRKKRVWPTTTSTTKKPILRRRQLNTRVAEESLGSGSQKDVVVINPSGGNIRRRRLPTSRSTNSNTSSTVKSFLPRHQNAAVNLQRTNSQQDESTAKSTAMKNTTPKEKTTEHRSRFSKEEIITKTSYPGLNNKENNDDDHEERVIGSRENGDSADSRDKLSNESIRKVSIMTKETPEHIYRTEETDKNGVKGKFVSITPNNGTNSSLDMDQTLGHRGLIDQEETREMLKGFKNSDESFEEDDSEISSMGADSHILANLLMQVPPHVTQTTSSRELEKEFDFSAFEGSGTSQDDENHDENDPGIVIRNKFVKDPDQRLYYYVED